MGTFYALNHFPKDMTFQTFLLDKDNKVVAMGNPILNPYVKELYLEKLTGVKADKPQTIQTEVSFDKAEIDFGAFPMNEKKEGKFVLTNTGQNLLVLYDVVTFCGCTKVEYSKPPVRITGLNVYKAQTEVQLSDAQMKNVEALANNELGPDRPDCEYEKDAECAMVLVYPNGMTGKEILDDHKKIPGWL